MLEYVLLGIAIGIVFMLIVIVCYKGICGYTIREGFIIRETSTHKILRVSKVKKSQIKDKNNESDTKDEECEWHIICQKFVYYTLPVSSPEVIYVGDKDKTYLKREFIIPFAIQKGWFHTENIKYFPMELHETLYIRENEIEEFEEF